MKARNNKSTLRRLSRDILSHSDSWYYYSGCFNGLFTYFDW